MICAVNSNPNFSYHLWPNMPNISVLREKQTSSKQTNPTFDPKWKKVVATGICLVVNQLSVKYTFGMLEFYFEIP